MNRELALKKLNKAINEAPEKIFAISETEFSRKPRPEKWSKKEILGHLIDSAFNNHQRFVRGQFEDSPQIGYDQDNWNKFSFHQKMDSTQLINFWTEFNKHMSEVISHIPESELSRTVVVGDDELTLEFLITDYVAHMEYHLKQIIDY
ncbi:MAG: DinB family protein [Bacteroidota bacterium]